MDEISEKIIDILSLGSNVSKDKLTGDTPIKESGVNSITFIQAVVKIEQELRIEFEDDDLDLSKYNTIDDLIKSIEQKVQATK